uniref:Uncharacterized protein n=1 Tax=Romanomermis culicivorax TaxID=13658 RepID=A0A915KPA6_ROMCU
MGNIIKTFTQAATLKFREEKQKELPAKTASSQIKTIGRQTFQNFGVKIHTRHCLSSGLKETDSPEKINMFPDYFHNISLSLKIHALLYLCLDKPLYIQ